MEALKRILFTNWHFMRWFRLVMGLFIAFQAFQLHNGLMGLLAGLFIFQALSNTGCCGVSGCSVNPRKENTESVNDIKFEEVIEKTKDKN